MLIHIPMYTTLTNEFGMPVSFAFAIEVMATLTNGRYAFTMENKHYRVAESDAQVIGGNER